MKSYCKYYDLWIIVRLIDDGLTLLVEVDECPSPASCVAMGFACVFFSHAAVWRQIISRGGSGQGYS